MPSKAWGLTTHFEVARVLARQQCQVWLVELPVNSLRHAHGSQRQESFATVSFLVSQSRYFFCGGSAAVRGDQLGAPLQPFEMETRETALGQLRSSANV